MRGAPRFSTRLLLFGCLAVPSIHAAASEADLERRFNGTVRPFLNSYCIGCHSGQAPASQFDLSFIHGLFN